MMRDLTRKPLDIGARIDQGVGFWRAYNERLIEVEALLADARREPLLLTALAKWLVRSVRAERRRLRRYLLARFGLRVSGSYPRIGVRIKHKERVRSDTLIRVVHQYDLLSGYVILDTALWAMGIAAKETTLSRKVDEVTRFWWFEKYKILRPLRQDASAAETTIRAYIYVMRNAPVAHSALASGSHGPPAQERLREAAVGLLSAWVRSQIRMYPGLEAALAEEGKPKEVIREQLPGAVMAEIAELHAAYSDPNRMTELMEEIGQRGVYAVLRNRAVSRLRTGGSAQRSEAREKARKSANTIDGISRAQAFKKREDEARATLEPPAPDDPDIEEFELRESMRQLLDQLKGWVEAADFSGREAQVHELDMQTDFDTAAISHELGIPTNKVRDYRSRYQAKIRRAAGL